MLLLPGKNHAPGIVISLIEEPILILNSRKISKILYLHETYFLLLS